MGRRPVFEIAQAATDGRLLEILGDLRAKGLSVDRITAELWHIYGVNVSGPTVKAWIDRDLEPLNNTA